ncbi:MAG: diacylglycerol kinase family protein [Clostridia bacterium]|nr:diacylglycerol kinase family protein [Clostridia bacterium]
MRYIFIVNPKAGKKDSTKIYVSDIEKHMKNRDIPFEIIETTHARNATEIVKAKISQYKGDKLRFYGFGGDGTLRELCEGVANEPNAELGIFPVGSGNDYIKIFGEKDKFLDFKAQLNGKSVKLDAIKSEFGISLNICSVGLDAKVAHNMVKFKNLPFVSGSVAYDLALVKSLLSGLGENLNVRLHTAKGIEEFKGEFLFALAANGQYYGGGFRGAPKSIANDGIMDLILIKKPPLYLIPSLIGVYKRGEHIDSPVFRKYMIYRRGTKMEISTWRDIPSNHDGECSVITEESFEVMPSAVNFILPEGVSYP